MQVYVSARQWDTLGQTSRAPSASEEESPRTCMSLQNELQFIGRRAARNSGGSVLASLPCGLYWGSRVSKRVQMTSRDIPGTSGVWNVMGQRNPEAAAGSMGWRAVRLAGYSCERRKDFVGGANVSNSWEDGLHREVVGLGTVACHRILDKDLRIAVLVGAAGRGFDADVG